MKKRPASSAFEELTIGEAYQKALRLVKDPVDDELGIRLLLSADIALQELSDLFLHEKEKLRRPTVFWERFTRFQNGEPVEYLLGEALFLKRHFRVDERVLIPRVETEEVTLFALQAIKEHFPSRKLLIADVCTGSGVIGITLGLSCPKARIILTDNDPKALEVASMNAQAFGLDALILCGDALAPLLERSIEPDVIIANPPYIIDKKTASPSVLTYEPEKALLTDPSLPVYEAILQGAAELKKRPLLLVFETDPSIHDRLEELIQKHLPQAQRVFACDGFDRERMVSIFLK